MPSNPIENLIRDTGPFAAEYVPHDIAEKPSSGCDLPDPVPSLIRISTLPIIKNELDCNTNFVEVPIFPVPFIPPFEGPCPDGFHFEAQFVPAVGQYMVQQGASAGLRALTMTGFSVADSGIDLDTAVVLPEIHAYFPVTSSGLTLGAKTFPVADGQRYVVNIADYDPETMRTKGATYNSHTYRQGQTFKGVPGVSSAVVSDSALNSAVTLKNSQKARILDYERAPGGATVYINETGFVVPSSGYHISDFVFNRLVVGADPDKETGGGIAISPGACGGKLFGEININFDDLGIPCANGFSFDAGYSAKPGESLVISGTSVTSSTVNLVDLVDVRPSGEPGLPYPMPHLKVKVGSSWVVSPVTSVNLDGSWTLSTPVTSGTYTEWNLQRVTVQNASPTGGQFDFIRSTDGCGGRLVGQINIDVPDLTTPCAVHLTNGTLVSTPDHFGSEDANNRAFKVVDKLRYTSEPSPTKTSGSEAITWSAVTPPTDKHVKLAVDAPLTGDSDHCDYQLAFTPGAQISLPNIQIILTVGGTRFPFKRVYDSGDETLQFTADLDQGTTIPGGGTSSGSCSNCCRWS